MRYDSPSDEEIIAAIKKNKNLNETVRYLYQAHFDSLANFIRTNSGRQEDAEDYFQETLAVFINIVHRDKFRGDSSIKTFLHSIMRNLWLNELKRRNKALARETVYYEQSEKEVSNMQHTVHESETTRQVLALFDRLGENCKKILVMFFYQDKSMKEIALAMNYDNEQVARNTKYKCAKKLIDLLDSSPAMKEAFKNLLRNH
jgi:RNA polymerase sigma factor (sigma-70 family)